MTTKDSMDVSIGTVCGIVFFMLIFAGYCWTWGATRGLRRGTCVEMCRPAQFDNDQEVNGGCLCIGSDKVLRRRPSP